MGSKEASSRGGKTQAKLERDAALKRYYAHPNECEECKTVIEVLDGQTVQSVRRKRFCTHRCAQVYNNRLRELKVKKCKCKDCGKDFEQSRVASGKFAHKRICRPCAELRKIHGTVGSRLRETKGQVYAALGYSKGRIKIRDHAARMFLRHHKYECAVCGYTKHVEACHIKSVASFSDSTLIIVINDPKNLIGLCPTHHWEYDNDGLKIGPR